MFIYVPGLGLLGVGGAPPPSLAIKLWLKNIFHIFPFLTSSLKPSADGTSYYARIFPKSRP